MSHRDADRLSYLPARSPLSEATLTLQKYPSSEPRSHPSVSGNVRKITRLYQARWADGAVHCYWHPKPNAKICATITA